MPHPMLGRVSGLKRGHLSLNGGLISTTLPTNQDTQHPSPPHLLLTSIITITQTTHSHFLSPSSFLAILLFPTKPPSFSFILFIFLSKNFSSSLPLCTLPSSYIKNQKKTSSLELLGHDFEEGDCDVAVLGKLGA